MAPNSITIDPDDGDHEGSHDAFVFFRLYPEDKGRLTDRTNQPQFTSRTPSCIQMIDNVLLLELFNIGGMASDFVGIDYQLIYCTASRHGVDDAFTSRHFQEVEGSVLDKFASVSVVKPGSSAVVPIDMPPRSARVYNIYFRARISTLWEESLPMDEWDFENDVKVTEFYHRVV